MKPKPKQPRLRSPEPYRQLCRQVMKHDSWRCPSCGGLSFSKAVIAQTYWTAHLQLDHHGVTTISEALENVPSGVG